MKKQKLLLVAIVVAAGLSISMANAQTKETTIKGNDGSNTTVRTDSEGTRTTTDGSTVYTTRADRHDDQVESYTKQGGTVTKTTK